MILITRLERQLGHLNNIIMNKVCTVFKTIGHIKCNKSTTKRLLSTRSKNLKEFVDKLKYHFPDNWLRYWKTLYIDYKEVATGIYEDYQHRPIRATTFLAFSATCYYLTRHNPNELMFRDQLTKSSQKFLLIGKPIQNSISLQYVKWLEHCYNKRVIRKINLGIFSLLWLDDYDSDCDLYKAICPYLKPRYVTFHERLLDVGFLDTWWILENYMTNYDVADCNK